MYAEAIEASSIVEKQLNDNSELMELLGQELRRSAPRFDVTCARGSSDLAATNLIETVIRTPTASAAPSVSSVYGARQSMQDVAFLASSQLAKSPDLLATAKAAKEAAVSSTRHCNTLAEKGL